MPTVKIGEVKRACRDDDHEPKDGQVFEPGVYLHTCPACGAHMRFTIPDGEICYRKPLPLIPARRLFPMTTEPLREPKRGDDQRRGFQY